MRKELGSEFYSVPTLTEGNGFFRTDTKWFVSGTSALEYILEDILSKTSARKAALPSWCCSCMITPFLKHGIDVVFFPVIVGKELGVVCDLSASAGCDITLVLHYFGYCSQLNMGTPHGIVIQDMTHSLFTGVKREADYFFGSLRKWAGFYTGGFAWSDIGWSKNIDTAPIDPAYVQLRSSAMERKLSYLIEEHDCKDFVVAFEQGEAFLDSCCIMDASLRDVDFAHRLDIEFIRSRRRENASVLLEKLKDIAFFPKLNDGDCPLFVPIHLPNDVRNSLKRFLIEHDIYCPVHWPISDVHSLSAETIVPYECGLSIVCDQRYDADDMRRILCVIDSFFK